MKKSVRTYLLKTIAVLTVVFASYSGSKAQMMYEAGISVGPSNFLGDLGGNQGKGQTFVKDNNIQLTRIMPGIYFTLAPNHYFNFRAAFNWGRLEGADSIINSKGGLEQARADRNQHFKSPILELFVAAEFYPTVFLEEDPEDVWHKFRPYGLLGVGAFHFNPRAQYIDPNGRATWVDLKPLRTEGQGMPNHPNRQEYNLTQISIPYGVGIKYFFSEKVNLSLEVVNRKTFTDYIDDVSTEYIADQDFYDYFGAGSATADIARQMANKAAFANGGTPLPSYGPGDKRGTATNNDAFYSTVLRLGIRFGGENNRNFIKNTRCPAVRF
ncbi:MAG: DUF6089 family protein [Chitinophagaceae bacterium]